MGNKSPYHHKNKQTKVEEKNQTNPSQYQEFWGQLVPWELKALYGIPLQLAVPTGLSKCQAFEPQQLLLCEGLLLVAIAPD